MKNWKKEKKQLKRLWAATAHESLDRDFIRDWYEPARKPMTGKAMRRLVGTHYRALEEYEGGWCCSERPKFRKDRRYVILAESRESLPEVLYIQRL